MADWLDGWAHLDGCASAAQTVTGADLVAKRVWGHCAGGASMVAYATTAGHAWPAELDGQAAADVVWAFRSSDRLR